MLSSGMSETHGAHIGVNKASSEWFVVSTILLLNQAATGALHLTPGLKLKSIILPRKNKTIQRTIKLFMTSLSLNTVQAQQMTVSLRSGKDAVFQKHSSLMARFIKLKDPGIAFLSTYCQRLLTGEMWMDVIICLGLKTSIFQDTVDHVGLKVLQVP